MSLDAAEPIFDREVASLRPHPRNHEVFPDLSDAEFEILLKDIEKCGIRDPILITDEGVIISGHQRWRVAKTLSLKEVPCQVYSGKNEDAIFERLVMDNLARRQLNPLGVTRALLKLGGYVRATDLLPRLTKLLGMTERNARRYLSLAQAPQEIQQAFDAHEITLQVAVKAASLPPETLRRMTRATANGSSAKQLIEAALDRRRSPEEESSAVVGRRIAAAIKSLEQLTADLDQYDLAPFRDELQAVVPGFIAACKELLNGSPDDVSEVDDV